MHKQYLFLSLIRFVFIFSINRNDYCGHQSFGYIAYSQFPPRRGSAEYTKYDFIHNFAKNFVKMTF